MNEDRGTLLAELTLTRSLAVQWAVLSLGSYLVALVVIGTIYTSATGETAGLSLQFNGEVVALVGYLVAVLVLTLVVAVPHEFVHGAVMSFYGATPEYGAGLAYFVFPYAYATSGTHRFSRNQFIAIALAPLIVLSVVGVALMIFLESVWAVVPVAANAGGAIGDLWMVFVLLQYPRHVQVEDRTTEMRIYGDSNDVRTGTPFTRRVRGTLLGSILCFSVLEVLAVMVAPVVFGALGVGSIAATIPLTTWMLFEYVVTSGGGYSVSANIGIILLISIFVGISVEFLRTTTPPKLG